MPSDYGVTGFRSEQQQAALQRSIYEDAHRLSTQRDKANALFYASSTASSSRLYGYDWPRQPINVRCDGWVSDTITLQRHGYKFMADYDTYRQCTRLAIGKNGSTSMIMVEDVNRLFEEHLRSNRPMEFHGEFISRMHIQEERVVREAPQWRAVDMIEAQYCEIEQARGLRTIDVRELFPQSETAEESVIVLPDQATVKTALETILELQEPRQQEIKERQRKRNAATQRHAQIVTLEDVA